MLSDVKPHYLPTYIGMRDSIYIKSFLSFIVCRHVARQRCLGENISGRADTAHPFGGQPS